MNTSLLRLFAMARKRTESESSYREMQRFIAEQSVAELHERGIDISHGSMLELAAGPGGYTQVFAERSPDFVATDLERWRAFDDELSHVDFRIADATKPFPFDNDRFDFVYCASLVEHLEDRSSLYSETSRVLTPGGAALFSFPPFWSLSLVGGHQFKPYHLLSERLAVARAANREGVPISRYSTDYGHGGLYPLTIAGLRTELEKAGWGILDVWARMWPVNTARLPGILADLLTWHACFLVVRR